MAAKHITQYNLNGLTAEQFTILLLEAAQSLGWRIGREKGDIVLFAPRSAFSNGEKMPILVDGETATIESKNKEWQIKGAKKHERNLTELTAKLDELRLANTPEELTAKYNDLTERQEAYAKGLEERRAANNLTAEEKISLGEGGRYVTYTLIAVNLLIFVAMVISGAGFMDFSMDSSLAKWGANTRSLTANGEWYRLITSTFLHGGLLHVLFNMYALFYIGIYLEPLLGRWRYLAAYLACGIFASLASVWWSDDRVSVGASGAIFGLYGVFLALLTTNFLDKGMRKPMLQSIGIFVIFNLVYGTKAGIDNSAHVGGLLSGAAFGYLYYFFFLKKKDSLVISIVLTVALAVAGIYFILPEVRKRPMSDSTKYLNSLDRFGILENKALAIFNETPDTSFSPEAGEKFKTVALPAWNQCSLLLDSAANYDMPKEYKDQREKLKKYVDLRITESNLYFKRETEKTDNYNKDINTTRKAIADLLESSKSKK